MCHLCERYGCVVRQLDLFFSRDGENDDSGEQQTAQVQSGTATVTEVHSQRAEIIIQRPVREDVDELCELLVEHFGYFYNAAFGTDSPLTRLIFKDILMVNRGKHPLGYKSFYVARAPTTREIVACLLFHTRESWTLLNYIAFTAGSAFVILRHIGVMGFIKTIRNLRKLRTEIPTLSPDEVHILYLAVSPKMRSKHIGRRMIEHIYNVPESRHKKVFRLEVRETNKIALLFFRNMGFSEDGIKTSSGDEILGRGPIVQMIRE